MVSEGKIQWEAFIVRRATGIEDLQWVIELATEEGFTTRENDAECYISAGIASEFFIGELNGERISCISVVRHGESVAFIGYYIVTKPHRGKGYGLKTWTTALAGIDDQCNRQLVAVMNMNDQYQKSGFQPRWTIRRYAFSASHSLASLASCQVSSSVAQILPASQADFEKLFEYGADMLGTSQACQALLTARLSHTRESSWVAIGNKGEVVGYLIMSKTTQFQKHGYRVAPFFADSVPIALSLLKVAVSFASVVASAHVFFDIAADFHPEVVNMLENEIGAKPRVNLIFMATKETSKLHHKMFGYPSLEVM